MRAGRGNKGVLLITFRGFAMCGIGERNASDLTNVTNKTDDSK